LLHISGYVSLIMHANLCLFVDDHVCMCVCVCVCVGLSKCLVCDQLCYLYAEFITCGALCWSYECVNSMARQSLEGQGLHIEASPSHSVTPYSVGLFRTRDHPDGETCTWQQTTLVGGRYPCLTAGFEPAIPASERPHTQAVIGKSICIAFTKFWVCPERRCLPEAYE
jgi:hypothetical protein